MSETTLLTPMPYTQQRTLKKKKTQKKKKENKENNQSAFRLPSG
jgi:hypothetical protein